MRIPLRRALIVAVATLTSAGALALPTPAYARPDCDDTPQLPICQEEEPDAHNPLGEFAGAARVPGGIRVTGWAQDLDGGPVPVVVTVDGAIAGTVPANQPSPEHGNAGFDAIVPAVLGSQVCAIAKTVGAGLDAELGCVPLAVTVAPTGALESLPTAGPDVEAVGWALDPDTAASIQVTVRQDGVEVTTVTANGPRPDVGEQHPGYGDGHGFRVRVPRSSVDGTHSVCAVARAVNLPGGPATPDAELGCLTYQVSHNPYGSLDSVTRERGRVRVRGVAYDPDAPGAALVVPILAEGGIVTYAGTNAAGEFEATFVTSLVPGEHSVCAEANNTGAGNGNTALGCRSYDVPFPVGTPQITFRAVSASEVVVDWTPADANAVGFRIEHNFGVGWIAVGPLGPDARTYTERGLTPGQPVCVKVIAFNDFSERLAAVCGHSLKTSLGLVHRPDEHVVSLTETSVKFTWTDASVATEYVVEIAAAHEPLASVVVPRNAARTYEHEFTGLQAGTNYAIYIRRSNPEYELKTGWFEASDIVTTHRYPEIWANVAPASQRGCTVGRQIVAHAQYATRLEIRQGTTTLVAVAGDQTAVYPVSDTDTSTYTIVAVGLGGGTSTEEAKADEVYDFPLTNQVTFANSSDHDLVVVLSQGVEFDDETVLGALPARGSTTVTVPQGYVGVITVRTDRWDVVYTTGQLTMGHCAGGRFSVTV